MNTTDTLSKLGKSEKYRSAFAMAQFKRLVPFQIRALRKQRGWSQETLAGHANVTQGVISRAEDSDNGNLTVNTILRIADGFGVVFVGKFVPYSEFIRWYEELSENLPPTPSFEQEYPPALEGIPPYVADLQSAGQGGMNGGEILKALRSDPPNVIFMMPKSNGENIEQGRNPLNRLMRAEPKGEAAYGAICGNARSGSALY